MLRVFKSLENTTDYGPYGNTRNSESVRLGTHLTSSNSSDFGQELAMTCPT